MSAATPGQTVRPFVRPEEVETQVFPWGSIKWLSEPRVTGTERFTMGVVVLEPGKGHTRHNHPGVEEILYVVSGEGEQMVEVPDVFADPALADWQDAKFLRAKAAGYLFTPEGAVNDTDPWVAAMIIRRQATAEDAPPHR